MHRPQRLTGHWKGATGLAWHVSPLADGADLVWHNGGMEGFRSWLGFVAPARVGVVVLTNCGKPVDALGRWLMEEALELYGKGEVTPPEEGVAKVAQALMQSMGSGADETLLALFHPNFLKAVPPAKVKALAAGIRKSHGTCTLNQAQAGTPPHSLTARLRCERGRPLRLKVQVGIGQPARIIYMLLQ